MLFYQSNLNQKRFKYSGVDTATDAFFICCVTGMIHGIVPFSICCATYLIQGIVPFSTPTAHR